LILTMGNSSSTTTQAVYDIEPDETETTNVPEKPDPERFLKLHKAITNEIDALKKFISSRDVEDINRAINKSPIDCATLISVLCNRSNFQIDGIKTLYYEKHGKSLSALAHEKFGKYIGDLFGYSFEPYEVRNAKLLNKAFSSHDADVTILMDVACLHSNNEVASIKACYEKTYEASFEEKLENGSSGDVEKILRLLYSGAKDESNAVDNQLAAEQAVELYEKGVGKTFGTDEEAFINILCKSSKAQVRAIQEAYNGKYEKNLAKAIKSEFSRKSKKCLQALLFTSRNEYIVHAIDRAFSGLGTDEERIAYILAGLSDSEKIAVKSLYEEKFGESLEGRLQDELHGPFQKAAIAFMSSSNKPTQGEELLNASKTTNPEELTEEQLQLSIQDLKKELLVELDFIALSDAMAVYRACEGRGTKDEELIGIICSRSKSHLYRINGYYEQLFDKTLVQQIQEEMEGYYLQLMIYLIMPCDEVDAMVFREACNSSSKDNMLVIEALAPLDSKRLNSMQSRFEEKYGKSVKEWVQRNLSGLNLKIALALLGSRVQGQRVDEEKAKDQAKRLKAPASGVIGTENTFIEIMFHSNKAQIECIKKHFNSMFGKSLLEMLREDPDDKSRLALASLISAPAEIYASALKRALNGEGTDDAAVARILGSNDKAGLIEIIKKYNEVYGESLSDALANNLIGNFKFAAVTHLASADPTMPEELRVITGGLSTREEEERFPTKPIEKPEDVPSLIVNLRSSSIVMTAEKMEENVAIDPSAEMSDVSEASGHSSDDPDSDDDWQMTPELKTLFNKKRVASAKGNRFKTRLLSRKIKKMIAEQENA